MVANNEQNEAPQAPVPVDLNEDGYATRAAVWRMALGMQELVELERSSARELPSRGTSTWLGELAAQHAHGEVETGALLDAVELHYLGETDDARLVERRSDILVTGIVLLVLGEPGNLSVRSLAHIHETLFGTGSAAFRTADIEEPEQILGGRSVQYIPHGIIEDVAHHELASFSQVLELPGLQGQRNLGRAIVKLLAGLWRTRPFGRNDALVLAVFLLQVLKRHSILIQPDPLALHAPYLRNALVRSCYSSVDPCVGETLRFLELFCSNLFAGGAFPLRADETICHELMDKSFELQYVIHSADRGFYLLKIHDTPLATIHFEPHRMGDITIEGMGVEGSQAHLLPLNLMARCDQMELERFVKSRVLARGRAHRGDILGAYGISGARTWPIVHFSHGACAMDAYSLVRSNNGEPYRGHSLFGNELDPTLQRIALTGGLLREEVRRVGVPGELTSGGKVPKAWRADGEGGLALYKASPRSGGHGPGTEHLASLIAQAIGAGGVSYGMGEWHGKTCSTCKAFTSGDISFTPFGLCMDRDALGSMTFPAALAFYDGLGEQAGEAFRTIVVLDYLLANPGRGVTDHGVMRDTHSGEILGTAPAFDFEEALFSREEGLPGVEGLLTRASRLPGMFRGSLAEQADLACGDAQRVILERAATLDAGDLDVHLLEGHDPTMLERLEVLVAFVRARADQLLR
jgi:hypothetical protein